MADLFLRYLSFLLFNPKPMNQQERVKEALSDKRRESTIYETCQLSDRLFHEHSVE